MTDMPRPSSLAALIDDVRSINEWSDMDIARRSQQAGHKLTKSDISAWRNEGVKQLVPYKVRALAAGLGLPAYRVALTILSDLGIDVPFDARTPEAAIEHDPTLSLHVRQTLKLLIDQDRRHATR